jgi:hypothetical protein
MPFLYVRDFLYLESIGFTVSDGGDGMGRLAGVISVPLISPPPTSRNGTPLYTAHKLLGVPSESGRCPALINKIAEVGMMAGLSRGAEPANSLPLVVVAERQPVSQRSREPRINGRQSSYPCPPRSLTTIPRTWPPLMIRTCGPHASDPT